MAQQTGQRLGDVGITTARPPWTPVPMGVARRPPVRARQALRRSTAATASSARSVKWAGDWRRAYDYGDPQGEALAVHAAAGLIDVSTLGKLLVSGPRRRRVPRPPVPQPLLEPQAGPHPLRRDQLRRGPDRRRRHDLPPRRRDVLRHHDVERRRRRSRSGSRWWLADWRMDVHLTDLTQALCGGQPRRARRRARSWREVTDLDCSQRGVHATSTASTAQIAGVPCLILRIGFVGEVGYEIHFPAAHGEHLWDALLEAGAGARHPAVRPRAPAHPAPAEDAHPRRPGHRLRVDAVRRGDAVDRQARQGGGLHRQVGARALRASIEPETALVGFTMANGHVPTEGAVVIDGDGVAAGQVTSVALLAAARQGDRHGLGAGTALAERRRAITISDEGAHLRRDGPDQAVLRPRGGGAALVSLEFLAPDAAVADDRRADRAQPDGARRARRRRAASRSATAGTSRSATARPSGARGRAGDRRLGRRLAPRQARAARSDRRRPGGDRRRGGRRRDARARHGRRARPTRGGCR